MNASILTDSSGRFLIRCVEPLDEVMIGPTIEFVCEGCFACWRSLMFVTIGADSKLSRLEWGAFDERVFGSITLPPGCDCALEPGWPAPKSLLL
jgi:hypothetical protein